MITHYTVCFSSRRWPNCFHYYPQGSGSCCYSSGPDWGPECSPCMYWPSYQITWYVGQTLIYLNLYVQRQIACWPHYIVYIGWVHLYCNHTHNDALAFKPALLPPPPLCTQVSWCTLLGSGWFPLATSLLPTWSLQCLKKEPGFRWMCMCTCMHASPVPQVSHSPWDG